MKHKVQHKPQESKISRIVTAAVAEGLIAVKGQAFLVNTKRGTITVDRKTYRVSHD